MARPIQSDLFAAERKESIASGESKHSPLRAAPPLPPYRPNLDDVRARLSRMLEEMRAAEDRPLDEERLSIYRAIFPHMTGWLPANEGAQLRFEFETELERLKAA